MDHIRDISSAESRQPTVARGCDELSFPFQQPFGVDGRYVGDVAVSVQAHGVALGGLLHGRELVVYRRRETEHVEVRQVRPQPPSSACS